MSSLLNFWERISKNSVECDAWEPDLRTKNSGEGDTQIENSIGNDTWTKDKKEDLSQNAVNLIKKGLDIRPDRSDGKTFWDDFINVLSNNSEDAADLLNVNRDVISSWSSKIREGIKKAEENNIGRTSLSKTGI